MSLWPVADIHEEPEIVLELWQVLRTERGSCHMVGWRPDRATGRVSTAIVEFDPASGLGKTESGRVYRLSGSPGFSIDALVTLDGWALVNGETISDDLTAAVFASMRHAGFDPHKLINDAQNQTGTPHAVLTEVPPGFPLSESERCWGIDDRNVLPVSADVQLFLVNFCEEQAQEVAAEFQDVEIEPAEQEEILSSVYFSWESGLFINNLERVWVTKRTASLLGWACPESVFEANNDGPDKDD